MMKVIVEGIEEYFYEKLSKSNRHTLEKEEGIKIIHKGHTINLEISDTKLASLILEKKFGHIFKL